MKRKIVIVGGVAVGASAAARLRRLSEEDEIIILERDEFISFANCGLPYYIGDTIKQRSDLLVQTKEAMQKRFNIDVRNFSEVLKIDRDKKTLLVKNLEKEYELDYDILILSTGAKPIELNVEGSKEAKNLFTLRNIADMDNIKNYIKINNIKDATIFGGGFIGLEMAENLTHLGINVTVVSRSNSILNIFDKEMSKLIQNAMQLMGVKFKLGISAKKLENFGSKVILSDDSTLKSDINICAIGVLPENKLAKDANLDIGFKGGVKVNEFNLTNDENIYSAGDLIEVQNFITKTPTYIPLAWPANRQARLIADNINASKTKYNGTLGSSVIKIFDFVAASTGLNETSAKAQGYNLGVVHVQRGNHANYYPNSSTITLKLIYDKDSKKVLGAQAFGKDGTEKRIDVIATAIKFNAKIEDLTDLELCYAPPFSSAKDPVNIAGYVACNVEDGMYEMFYVQDVENLKNVQFIDVRTKGEFNLGHIEGTINIDVDDLRDNLEKIDFNKDIYLTCQVGLRGYLAARILKLKGFNKKIYNLSGGYKLYNDYKMNADNIININNSSNDEQIKDLNDNFCDLVEVNIDACGMQCPGPIMKLNEEISKINEGCAIDIVASDLGFYNDVKSWCNVSKNELIFAKIENGKVKARIMKSGNSIQKNSDILDKNSQTIVVFSNDLDKVIASFIIANGALAMGSKVTMFFTFWGLSVLRKENLEKNIKKSFMDRMFCAMLPKSSKKLNLSKMSMFGFGKIMLRKTMDMKNVESLESLIKSYIDNGGKIMACNMSMDVMGITKDELIDNIEYGGVASYISDSKNSFSNLFI